MRVGEGHGNRVPWLQFQNFVPFASSWFIHHFIAWRRAAASSALARLLKAEMRK
jgi:hypothetical protein